MELNLVRTEVHVFKYRLNTGFDQVFPLRLIVEKRLSYQTPLVFSFIDYVLALDSVDRTALINVLSLHGIPDKYIKVISAMYENNAAAVKVGNEVAAVFLLIRS